MAILQKAARSTDIHQDSIIMMAMFIFKLYILKKVGSGVYRVKTSNYEFNVYCNMEDGFDGYASFLYIALICNL